MFSSGVIAIQTFCATFGSPCICIIGAKACFRIADDIKINEQKDKGPLYQKPEFVAICVDSL